jgi:hypothetical protein
LLFAGLVDKVGPKLYDGSAQVVDPFGAKVLLGKILVVSMDPNHSTFENKMAFLLKET